MGTLRGYNILGTVLWDDHLDPPGTPLGSIIMRPLLHVPNASGRARAIVPIAPSPRKNLCALLPGNRNSRQGMCESRDIEDTLNGFFK